MRSLLVILIGLSVLIHTAFGAGHRTVTVCAGHLSEAGELVLCKPGWAGQAEQTRRDRHAAVPGCCAPRVPSPACHAPSCGTASCNDPGCNDPDCDDSGAPSADPSDRPASPGAPPGDGEHRYCPDVYLIPAVAGSVAPSAADDAPLVALPLLEITPIWAALVPAEPLVPELGPPPLPESADPRLAQRLAVVQRVRLLV